MGMARSPDFSYKQRTLALAVIWVLMVTNLIIADVARGQSRDPADESLPVLSAAETKDTPAHADIGTQDTSKDSTAEQDYSIYTNAEPPHKAYLRTSLEILSFLGISAGYYLGTLGDPKYYEPDNIQDSLNERFVTGEAYLLDVNPWESNVGHIAAGTGFYLLARSNDLSLAESMFATVAASTTWEMFGEYQDEFSINDAVMTPFGGFAIGEPMYQLGEFFQHSAHTIPNRSLGFLFGPSTAIHRWWDDSTPKAPAKVDKFGFTTDAWHRFRLYAGGGGSYSHDSGEHRSEAEMGFDFEVVSAEKYGKPGQASVFYTDSVFNQIAFNTALDGGEMADFRFFSKTAFLGHYQQDISKDDTTRDLEGYSLFAGLSSAVEYYSHSFSEMETDDKQAVCDLMGPTMIADYYQSGFHMRATLDAYPTFSMVQPAVGPDLIRDHNIAPFPTSNYALEGYYFALGATAAGRVEMDYGPFGLDGQVRYNYFNSIEGLDSIQETESGVQMEDDVHFEDQRLWVQLTVYCALPIENLKLALDAQKIYRWTEIESVSRDLDETRYLAKVVFEF